MNLDTAEAFSDYFGRLARGVSEPEVFLSYYEPFLRKLGDDWLQVFDERWLAMGRGVEETLSRLGELYARNYAPFCATVWPTERPGMASVASRINNYFSERDIIGDWERFTGVQWKTDRYQIVLVSAIKDGPRANSLGYDRNVFYAYEDFDSMVRFIAKTSVGSTTALSSVSRTPTAWVRTTARRSSRLSTRTSTSANPELNPWRCSYMRPAKQENEEANQAAGEPKTPVSC